MESSGKKKWWQKIDIVDIIIASAIIPLVEKIIKHFGKKAEDILGLDFESAKDDVIDDIYFLAAQGRLDKEEILNLYDFKHWLREESGASGQDEESAFILYIAKMLKTFEREKKNNPAKGGSQYSEKDLEKGVTLATIFFKQLLSKNSPAEMRHFLENENVFTLIPKKKGDRPIIKKAKKFAKKKVAETVKGEKTNRQDFNKTTSDWRTRAKAWRNAR